MCEVSDGLEGQVSAPTDNGFFGFPRSYERGYASFFWFSVGHISLQRRRDTEQGRARPACAGRAAIHMPETVRRAADCPPYQIEIEF